MSYEKLSVYGYDLSVEFLPGLIRIKNDDLLKTMLKQPSNRSGAIARKIRDRYYEIYGESINISTNSLAVEILGHVFPDQVFNAIKNIPTLENISNKILSHTNIIDCGENDDERWVWNLLAPFYEFILGAMAG